MAITSYRIQKTIHSNPENVFLVLNSNEKIKLKAVESQNERQTCGGCFKIFNSLLALRIHNLKARCTKTIQVNKRKKIKIKSKKTANSKKEYPCEECDKLFENANSRRVHRFRNHRKLTPEQLLELSKRVYRCEPCNMEFRTSVALHMHNLRKLRKKQEPQEPRKTTPKTERFNCKKCSQSFDNKESLNSHKKEHTQSTNRQKCLVCGSELCNVSILHRHIVKIHDGVYPEMTEPKDFKCPDCDLAFISEKWLEYHMETHVRKWKKPQRLYPDKSRSGTCEICDKSVLNLAKHLKTHETKRPKCEVCGANNFYFNYLLERHIVFKHNGEYPGAVSEVKLYKCDICKLDFHAKKWLEYHMELHLQPKPKEKVDKDKLTCKVCHKVYKTTNYLKKHSKMHEEDNKIPCETCGLLVVKEYFGDHNRRNHSDKSKVFECGVCSRTFKFQSNLSAHMSTHSAERRTCNICGKVMASYNSLYVHKVGFHGIGGVKCENCKKSFTTRKLLNDHLIKCRLVVD